MRNRTKAQESFRAPSATSVIAGIAITTLLLIWMRTRAGLGRLPSDPGYDYFIAATERGWSSIWSPDPFPQVISRVVAWIAVQFPFELHAVIAGTITNVLWAALAAVAGYIVWQQWGSVLLSVMTGVFLALNPVARESALLNHGNLKWPLLSVTVLAISSPTFFRSHIPTTATLLLLTGLSQPLVFVAVVPLGIIALLDRNRSVRAVLSALLITGVGILFQVAVTGIDRSTSGHGASRILRPWPGMGIFWWFGLVVPLIIAVAAVVISLRRAISGHEGEVQVVALSTSAIALAVSSYFLGGIADRYFVAPMFLAYVSSMIIMANFWRSSRSWWKAPVAVGFVVLLLPCLRWFPASPWLTSGPLWSDEATRAWDVCSNGDVAVVQMGVTPTGATEVPCDLIRNG